jgi:vancomycin resistance protein YoaR
LDELGKAKSSTLFFLSKNGFMGDNIKFIKSDEISKEWEKCDYWVTDEKKIIDTCPSDKTVIKFNTPYNQHFTNNKEITKLQEIKETWLTSLEDYTTSISMQSQTNVELGHPQNQEKEQ